MKQERIIIEQLFDEMEVETFLFPKYVTQILNLANQNAQGTRPKIVGQLSELIKQPNEKSYEAWKSFYLENHGEKIDLAVEKIWEMVQNLKIALEKIDKELIKNWVYDLIINKTAEGLLIQEFILRHLATKFGQEYRLATPQEESQNIDGFIGEIPVQIKPYSYKTKTNVKSENINIPIIFYKKTKKYLVIEYDENAFSQIV